MEPGTAATLRAVGTARPQAEDLVQVFNELSAARYADDAPTDLIPVQISARRVLPLSSPDISARDAFLAVEMLADRGVSAAGRPEMLVDWPLQFAKSLLKTACLC